MNKLILGTMLIVSVANAEIFKLEQNSSTEISFKSIVYENETDEMNCYKIVSFGKGKNREIVSLKGTVECSYGKKKVIMETVDYRNNKLFYSKYDAFGVNLENYAEECYLSEYILDTYIEISNNIKRNAVEFPLDDLSNHCKETVEHKLTNDTKKENEEAIELLLTNTDDCPPSWQVRGRCLKSYFDYQPDGGWYCDNNKCD